ncbi:protein RSI-1 [Rosa sericea]|uniref:Putative gibberellin regulated protein n=1 Tax=Rosa chinensis TaxID=74649 RepID=A0A2P6RGP4_ROSCH|nr:protein RSI-1 [Rosa chinensis]XP_062004528.1 protein RSI-1 [Rosa rugosa]PRQ45592.1 putative gibberellin regulated protein [Rosa chinensis]
MAGRPYTSLLLLLSLLLLVTLSPVAEAYTKLRPQDCKPKCTYRCSATSHKKPCKFFCEKCCAKCLCVPPGTYGHKQVCPCYNNWKTQEGKPKCP